MLNDHTDEIIISPHFTEKNYWKDIWRFRELFYILSWRDIKVRYKQTVIGALWSIIRPLLATIIFTIVFNRVAKLGSSDAVPYVLMVYAGMMPWQFVSSALSEASNSLVGNSALITKVYFPRVILPASSIITTLVDFFISFSIMIGLMVWFTFSPGWQIVFLPLFIVLAFLAAFGAGLYLTALNVKFRDFRYVIPFVVQLSLYISPVGFSSENVPVQWKFWYSLNPLVAIIDGFRWCLLGNRMNWQGLWISIVIIVLFLYIGIWYFRKMEKTFADHI